jgi:phosphatidylserine decarboxylase
MFNQLGVKCIMMKTILRLLTDLSSRKFIAQITGKLAKSSFSKFLIPKFAKIYGIRIEEAEKEIHEYTSLNDFFTRRLKQGMRVLDANEQRLLSPVDARITGMGNIEAGQIVNVKGQDYTIKDLLNQSPRTVNYKNGYYFVLYLSPTDYHRIHAPISGKIIEKDHVPGRVYPVNAFALRHMPKVLSRNERLISYIHNSSTGGEVAVVKVGALNVSSIQYTDRDKVQLERGEDFAYFEFGSTIVLLMETGTFEPNDALEVGKQVQMGQSLGTLHKKSSKN